MKISAAYWPGFLTRPLSLVDYSPLDSFTTCPSKRLMVRVA